MPTRLNDIETTFRLRVDSALKGFDQVAKASDRVEKKLENLADTSTRIGLRVGAFGAAVTAGLALAVRGALEEQQALRELEGTVNATGGSFDASRERIDQFVQDLAKATKFTDDQIIPALNRAVFATNDLDKGFRAAELGVKLAAAGFGSVEQNAGIVARLLEGQVGAIARLIPEFRDLEERLEAGATEADLAAEALQRLQRQADALKPPSDIEQFTKQIGELKDTIGEAVITALAPFVPRLIAIAEAFTRFAGTGPGKAIIAITAFAGIIASVGGILLIFVGQITAAIAAMGAAGGLAAAAGAAGKAIGLLTLAFAGPAGLIAILVIAAGAIAAIPVILNKMSKAADEARDKTFQSDRLTQFRAEMEKLNEVITQFEAGTISLKEAQEELNKVGLTSIEHAKQRREAFKGIIERLEEEKAASEAASKADTNHGNLQAARIAKIIAELEKEKQANFELDTAKQLLFERDRKRGEELLRQAGLLSTPPQVQEPALPQIPGVEPDTTLADILDPAAANVFAEATGTVAERVQKLVDKFLLLNPEVQGLEEGLAAASDQLTFAEERAAVFGAKMEEALAGAIDGVATLAVNFGSDLVTNFNEAGKNAAKFFRQLIGDLIRAIAKALILEAIISAFGGGGGFVGRALKLFQDPRADQLARFEGSRFSDLFFQGMFREFNTSQERLESALTQNRDINRNNSQSMTAIVNEATPETTVEFTDRHVEPRVRQRANQRSSRGILTDAERDRRIENLNERLNGLGAT